MYPALVSGLNLLLPAGFEARSLTAASSTQGHPDLQIVDKRGGVVAHVEVKLTSTLHDVFAPGASGQSQAQKYRKDGIPVWLTDSVDWWDISDTDDLTQPITTFTDPATDTVNEARLKSSLHTACGIRPRHGLESAVSATAGVIAQINESPTDVLADGWKVVRAGLGLTLDDNALDGGGIGEIVTFTLLSIATQLPALPPDTFVSAASDEWTNTSARWNPGDMPAMMAATLRAFRDEDNRLNILGAGGWVAIRSVASWLDDGTGVDQWARLSNLWDTYLHHVGRRKTLGSWQTPRAVADYQAGQVASALRTLGYSGLGDTKVSVIDPCCGTGVYMEAVIARAGSEGRAPGSFNAPKAGHPRLVGVDLSSTAVAAAHIRVVSSGVRPALHMADTLATGSASSLLRIFDDGAGMGNPIVAAARDDFAEVQRWATRDSERDPILAIVGNPPYLSNGLSRTRYASLGWFDDAFNAWRGGSGGGRNLWDPFAAFWAWAATLCQQPHRKIVPPEGSDPAAAGDDGSRQRLFGVVSFITNRSWIDGTTFAGMRAWFASRAAVVEITDFGPGSRGGSASAWSEQPFAIQAGTAIVTVTFDPTVSETTIRYRKAVWSAGDADRPSQIDVGKPAEIEVGASEWTAREFRDIALGVRTLPGISTGDDRRWVQVDANRDFVTAHAYRAFDNRWTPTTVPDRARRGSAPTAGQASSSAEWRITNLRDPHGVLAADSGWYLLMQSPQAGADPGPALHATRHLPDLNLFSTRGGRVVRVVTGCDMPEPHRDWAQANGLDGPKFWLYVLAAGHHVGYWTPGTEMAVELAERRVDPPLSDDPVVVDALVELGGELVDLWSLDGVSPVAFTGAPGAWHFVGHAQADEIVVHGRKVLLKWREARPGAWDRHRALEYARSVAAILRVRAIADEVAMLLPVG